MGEAPPKELVLAEDVDFFSSFEDSVEVPEEELEHGQKLIRGLGSSRRHRRMHMGEAGGCMGSVNCPANSASENRIEHSATAIDYWERS